MEEIVFNVFRIDREIFNLECNEIDEVEFARKTGDIAAEEITSVISIYRAAEFGVDIWFAFKYDECVGLIGIWIERNEETINEAIDVLGLKG